MQDSRDILWVSPDGGHAHYVIVGENATQPVILWIELGDKPKWLPLNFEFNDVMMRTTPIQMDEKEVAKVNEVVHG